MHILGIDAYNSLVVENDKCQSIIAKRFNIIYIFTLKDRAPIRTLIDRGGGGAYFDKITFPGHCRKSVKNGNRRFRR